MSKKNKAKNARRLAREYAVQCLYQAQLTDSPLEELILSFERSHDFEGVDKPYWYELVSQCVTTRESLEASMKPYLNRVIASINPVELSILLIAFYEYAQRLEIPYRVVLNEAIELVKCFGAVDSHRFINGVLDAAAKDMRAIEVNNKS